jgi:hypothetical protein
MSNISNINGYKITAESASYAATASVVLGSITSASYSDFALSASYAATASYVPPTYIDNFITVGLPGSNVDYTSIKTAVDSIIDASQNNTYTVRVYPGIYIEAPMTVPEWVAVKGDSSISTVVSASNPSASLFTMSDQSMIIDMQVQGCTAPNVAAVYYSSPTTPQTNAISYVENVRFGTNYTNAICAGSGSGNCIMQCSNVKYGGYPFEIGFRVTGSGGSIGRMQLRNVTSTNGGITGSSAQIFALADAPGCTFIVNGCLLTRATGTAAGTGFKVYNGGQLRLTGVNFQRWDKGIWAPQTGSAPNIDAVALNFENCTTDILIEHTGSSGKIPATDNLLKTIIPYEAPIYEVATDQRKIVVAKKGGDFTSISASVAYITDSSETNRYVIDVNPGEFFENQIDLRGKPYISIVGSNIQTTIIKPSGSGNFDQFLLGTTNELSFLSIIGTNNASYAAIKCEDLGDGFAQAHKVSIYDFDYGVKVVSNVSSSTFFGEYIDMNGAFTYGMFVSSSNGSSSLASIENYYLFPSGGISTGNYAAGSGAELDLYTCLFSGDSVSGSAAIRVQNGAVLEAAGLDIQNWEYGVYVPNIGIAPTFRIVGSMIHESLTYDFNVLKTGTQGRFQGISDTAKINNVSEDFYWNFLDDTNGENNITRKLSVTFVDGTSTDATTLIFEGSPMGVMSGGHITISSSFTITTAAGYGYLQNVGSEVFQRIDWVDSNLTLSPNTNNYVFINQSSTLTSSPTQPNSVHNIVLGRVVTNTSGIELIDNSPYFAAHMSNALSKFNRNALGPVFSDGCIVSEDVTPFKLDISAGVYYFGENEYDPTGGSAITFTRYYQSGSGAFDWNLLSTDIVPSNIYNSGSALVAMSSSYYAKHTLYTVGEGPDEEYFLIVGQDQYATLVEAENAGLPFTPTYFTDGVVSLAAIYVQSGSANITQVQDIRPVIGFRASGVNASSVHGNLLGLNADDHQQYLLVDGTRAMSGNLNLDGHSIINNNNLQVSFISPYGTSGPAGIEVDSQTIYDISGNTAIQWDNRELKNSTSNTTVDWENRHLYDSTNNLILDWENKILYGNATSATSASYATTASYVQTAQTASYVQTAQTASYVQTAQTASYVLQAVSSSFATTSSYALSGNGSFSGSFSGSYAGDGSALTGVTATAAPAGPDTSIQFNNGGVTGGSADLTFDDTTNKLTLTGSLHITGSVDATIFTNTTKISGSASGAAGNYITTQFLGSDVTNNTTGLVTAMTTTGVGPGLYQFKYIVRYQSAATATGIGLAVDHTQASNYFVSSFWFVSTGGTAATGVADQVAATNAGQMVEGKSERVKGTVSSATAGVDTQNADMLAVMEGLINVSTSGDLILEFRSEVASSQVTIKSGTSLILTKMS